MKKTTNNSDELQNSFVDEIARKSQVIQADIETDFSNYNIWGDAEGLKKIIRMPGIVNISIDDIINILSESNSNYVTTGSGDGTKRLMMALKEAIGQLTISIDSIDTMIVHIRTNTSCPIEMIEIKDMIDWLAGYDTAVNLLWGIARDNELSGAEVKITLIAVSRYKISD